MPDDAGLDRFRPPLPGAPEPSSPDRRDQPAHQPAHQTAWNPPSEPLTVLGQPSGGTGLQPSPAPTATWDEWSHADRDRRERAALATRIRGDRGTQGLLHAQAVIIHRRHVRQAAAVTVSALLGFGFLWLRIIGARDAAIAQGLDARGLALGGFALLLLTVLAAVSVLRLWRTVYQSRVDPLQFPPLPDSPDAPRHGAFDGTASPPTRW